MFVAATSLLCVLAAVVVQVVLAGPGPSDWALVQPGPGELFTHYEGFGEEKVLAANVGCRIEPGFRAYRRANPKAYKFIFILNCNNDGKKQCEVAVGETAPDGPLYLMDSVQPNPSCQPLY